jgi:hypothetical protein
MQEVITGYLRARDQLHQGMDDLDGYVLRRMRCMSLSSKMLALPTTASSAGRSESSVKYWTSSKILTKN